MPDVQAETFWHFKKRATSAKHDSAIAAAADTSKPIMIRSTLGFLTVTTKSIIERLLVATRKFRENEDAAPVSPSYGSPVTNVQQCAICPAMLHDEEQLEIHMRNHHRTEQKALVCF